MISKWLYGHDATLRDAACNQGPRYVLDVPECKQAIAWCHVRLESGFAPPARAAAHAAIQYTAVDMQHCVSS